MSAKLLRANQAAEMLGVDRKTFRRWVKAGLIPAFPDPETGTKWFSVESLDAWKLAQFKTAVAS